MQRDQHHPEAVAAWNQLSDLPELLYTPEHYINETATLLARRTNYAFAADWGADLLKSGITVLQADFGFNISTPHGLMEIDLTRRGECASLA